VITSPEKEKSSEHHYYRSLDPAHHRVGLGALLAKLGPVTAEAELHLVRALVAHDHAFAIHEHAAAHQCCERQLAHIAKTVVAVVDGLLL